MNKKLILIGVILLLIFVISSTIFYFYISNLNKKTEPQKTEVTQTKKVDTKTVFTARIFDPALVSFIGPLGELNGGYEETQTINGVTVNNKVDANGNAPEIEVYAPTDMTLEDYSYFTGGKETPNYHLGFRISKDMKLSFDHITSVSDEMKAILPPTQNSGYVSPKKKIKFKAGEVIATTSGTDKAHNWNIYLRDNNVTNNFVNQERYEKIKEGYDYVNAACPFNYYEDTLKQQFLALMGATAAGQSKTCGTNSKDVKGSISGLWHLTKDGANADYQGNYATPFSIYKDSAERIILYETGRKRYIIGKTNSTYKDPAAVTASHCYALTEYPDERGGPKGYAYFKIVSDMEMNMAYSGTGSCPSAFPENIAKTYYR